MDCFVIMPFGDPAVDRTHFEKMECLYSDWIKPTVEAITPPGQKIGIRCHRADKDLSPGEIMDYVIEHLLKAHIVIADLTGSNPNVYYELGVRHAVSNATILLSEGTQHLPFDLRSLRAIIYSYTPPGMLKMQRDLKASIESILSSPEKIDNPVRRLLYQRETAKLLSQQVPPGFDVVRGLANEVTSLRSEISKHREEVTSLLAVLTKMPRAEPLERFEGVWIDNDNGTVFCIKVIEGALRCCYSYAGFGELTSHLYQCNVIGDLVIARFEWFGSDIKGFLIVRLSTPDLLEGGWCYEADAPNLTARLTLDASTIFALFTSENSGFYRLSAARDPETRYPKWALNYFRRYE